MTRPKLIWFQLRFPEGLEQSATEAALSSLSGLHYRGRVVFDLSATASGITHRLGVSQSATEAVTASLRAAMPSLRLQSAEAVPLTGRRSLWQLTPAVGALRTADVPASAAALLSSLFPLEQGETVRLKWSVRPGARPAPSDAPESQLDGRRQAVRAKLALAGLMAYGELLVTAGSSARTAALTQRVGAVLRSLSSPHGRLVADPPWYGKLAYLLYRRGRYFSTAELAAVIGWPVGDLDVPGLDLGAAKRLVPSGALPQEGRVLGTSDFIGMDRPVAMTAQASTRGLYILGPTGTGKTSLLKNLIRSDLEQGRGILVIETNGDLITDLTDLIPPNRVADVVLLDLTDPDFAVGFNPLSSHADPSLVADQIGELFHRLWKDFWGPRTAQLTHMALLTLARRSGSTLLDLPRLYLDKAFRAEVLAELDDPIGLGPDWQWFDNLSTREQATVTAPLLNKARQWAARPALRTIIGQPKPRISMRQVIEQQKVLLVHVPKGLIGSETAQLLGCLVLTSAWQAMTERTALPANQRHAFGIYADEVQDFADAPIPWDEMFAQGRKYGCALTVAHQNLEQLPKELRETILANARSKAIFALSAHDARVMEKLFAPALAAADLQALDAFSVAAQIALDDGSTARPVTLSTPRPPAALGSAETVREASRLDYARPRIEIEAALRQRASRARPVPIGRKKRSRS